MQSTLKNLLEATKAHPVLFVGSGFTHRYLKTEDWRGLISHFASLAKPETEFAFEYYRNEVSSDGTTDTDLPAITEMVEKDFSRRFLAEPEFGALRSTYSDAIGASISPLKIGVADHFQRREVGFSSPEHPEEISAIGHARKNVAGIITTNFDPFLEHLFPEHVTYIGQNELLFNQSYGIGEIYKIHGCASKPESLILNSKDYASYNSRNAYLSAKLKKDIYDLVQSTTPKERIKVIDIDESTDLETIDYVMGVGVSKQLAGLGYSGLSTLDLTEDLIYDRDQFDATQVIESVLPTLGRQNSYNLPVFKYLSNAKDPLLDDCLEHYIADATRQGISKWISTSMRKARRNKAVSGSIEELREKYDFSDLTQIRHALTELPFMESDHIDLQAFRELLVELHETYHPLSNDNLKSLPTDFRRAVRIYDWLKYGHKKTPEVPKDEEAG